MKPSIKLKSKYDLWFLIVLTIILWTVATLFVNHVLLLWGNYTNIGLWARTLATGLATFGAVWVIKIYLRSVKGTGKKSDTSFEEDTK